MTRVVPVAFHGDTLLAVEHGDQVFVAVKPIAAALGLDPKRQRDRIQRDPVLSGGGAIMALPSAQGVQETFCLRLDLLNGWLFGIDVGRVREGSRARVLAYQRECCAVLFRHFQGYAGEGDPPAPVQVALPLNARIILAAIGEARLTFGEQASGQLWAALGMPVMPAMRAVAAQLVLDFGRVPAVGEGGG